MPSSRLACTILRRHNRRLLILGGTVEGRELAERMSSDARWNVISSLAGRTVMRADIAGETHVGGFGGVVGLRDYLRDAAIDVVADCTHPYADRISAHAVAASREAGVRYFRVEPAGLVCTCWRAMAPGTRCS